MARALEKLAENPIQVPAGPDNRNTILHPARYLGGPVTAAKQQWLIARDIIGLDGLVPLSTYDMGCLGLAGSVTNKGWAEVANPGSSGNCLKLYSAVNIGTSASASRRFSLTDGDGAIAVGENMKEISDIRSFTHALSAMVYAARHVMPWNFSYAALERFLVEHDFLEKELAHSTNRVGDLVNFVNYVLGINAQNWQRREPFLAVQDLKNEFNTFAQRLPPAPAVAVADGQSQFFNHQHFRGRGGFRGGRRGFQNYGSKAGQHRGGASSSGGGGASSAAIPSLLSGMQAPATAQQSGSHKIICRRYNAGTCPNFFKDCVLPLSGSKAWHICSKLKSDGSVCGGAHPAIQHK